MAKKEWVQKADRGIEKAGTEGALTRQAKARGWASALPFARAVVRAWDRSKKTGKPPTVLNKKTGKQSAVDVTLWRRANFAVNVQPKNGKGKTGTKAKDPRRFSVRFRSTSGHWNLWRDPKGGHFYTGLTYTEAKREAGREDRQGYFTAVFDGSSLAWQPR